MPTVTLPRGTWTFDDTRTLGKPGGFGRVHPGTGEGGQPIAIKLLNRGLGDAANRELEFAQGQVGKTAKHLIPIFDAGVDPSLNQTCIVMEIANGNLRDAIEKKSIDQATALDGLVQIARGLLEAGDWIHRDLKPENILFANGRWQITDFGIGRIAEATTASQTLKAALSPPYAAPEQWKGVRATHATDVYALGCIATELLSGQRPFAGPTPADYERQHQTEAPTITNVLHRSRSLLLRMLAKPAAARPTVEKVIAEINSIQSRPQGSGGGAQSLSGAAASVAEETAKREAAEAAFAAEKASRAELSIHSFDLLRGIADQLFAEIADHAPQAQIDKREEYSRVSVYSATLGRGTLRMTVGQHSSIPKAVFAGSRWDVVSGDAIFVTSGDYTRSASLWYADVDHKGEYLWIEMGYWPTGGSTNNTPTHLDPGRDAALAASNVMHNWNLANPIRLIEGDGTNDFCQRWMGFLAQAANRKLSYPPCLPEA